MNGGFYVPGYQPFGIEQVQLLNLYLPHERLLLLSGHHAAGSKGHTSHNVLSQLSVSQIPLVDGVVAAVQAGLGNLDQVLVPAAYMFMGMVAVMVALFPFLCVFMCVDALTGHRLLQRSSATVADHRQQEQVGASLQMSLDWSRCLTA